MASASYSLIDEIDRQIVQAERVIHEHIQSIIAALRKGADTTSAEGRVRELRAGLELLYGQRRRMVRGAYQSQAPTGQPSVQSINAA
jgi:hypothetical protein